MINWCTQIQESRTLKVSEKLAAFKAAASVSFDLMRRKTCRFLPQATTMIRFLDLNKTQAQELKPDNMLRPVMSSSVCQNVLMKVIYSRVWRDQSISALCVHVCVCDQCLYELMSVDCSLWILTTWELGCRIAAVTTTCDSRAASPLAVMDVSEP